MNHSLRLPRPDRKLNAEAIFWISFVHLGAAAAFLFFSWTSVALCLGLLFTMSPVGVTLTYHRMLAHRSFQVPKWLEYPLATVGVLTAQGSPLLWVAGHRVHHQHADTTEDPHTPRKGLFYSHIGHLLYDLEHTDEEMLKHVPDLTRQPYYRFLHRNHLWISLSLLPILFMIGGWSFVLWGGFMRVALMLHITWLVNSASHTWGYRNFATRDDSRNCWWVALLAAGEGWHNNHHAQPSCAAHGRKWWEFDLTWNLIRSLERLGLATQVIRPRIT